MDLYFTPSGGSETFVGSQYGSSVGAWQHVTLPQGTITAAGTLRIEISVEGPGNPNDLSYATYFDDLTIDFTSDPVTVITTSLDVLQVQDYYPFGLTFNQGGSRTNNYLFNGVELDGATENYEMAFRGYDASIGRFMQVDPLVNVMPGISPYHFGYNNPISYNDPLGLQGEKSATEEAYEWFANSSPGGPSALQQQMMGWEQTKDDIDRRVEKENQQTIIINGEVYEGYEIVIDGQYAMINGKEIEGSRKEEIYFIPVGEPSNDGASDDLLLMRQLVAERDAEPWGPSRAPYKGFGGTLGYLWTGGNENGIHYNWDGKPTGWAPITGIAPDISPAGKIQSAYTVYKAIAKNGKTYWGITKNIARRAKQHGGRFPKGLQEVYTGVSRSAARGLEQLKIDQYGLKNLDNIINSVGRNNPKLADYYRDATRYLKNLNTP